MAAILGAPAPREQRQSALKGLSGCATAHRYVGGGSWSPTFLFRVYARFRLLALGPRTPVGAGSSRYPPTTTTRISCRSDTQRNPYPRATDQESGVIARSARSPLAKEGCIPSRPSLQQCRASADLLGPRKSGSDGVAQTSISAAADPSLPLKQVGNRGPCRSGSPSRPLPTCQ